MSSQLQREIDQLTVAIDLLSERPRPISKKPQIARLKARRGELKLLRDTGVVIQPPLRRRALEVQCAPCPNMEFPIEENDMTELQGYYLGDQNLPNEHFGDSPAEVITNAQHLSSLPDPDCWILQFDGDRLIDQWPLDHFRLQHLEPATEALETVEATA